MKRRNLLISFALLLVMPISASSQLLKGTALLNGEPIKAEYTKLSSNTVAIGTGQNACISQYSEGRLAIPATVTIDGITYDVTAVSDLAFRFCTKLTFVELQGNVTKIGNFAFVGCTGLREIVMPASVQRIGTGAFRDVPLINILCAATTPPVWEYNDVFRFKEGGIGDDDTHSVSSSVHIIVPESAIDNYKNALYDDASLGWTTPDGWGRFLSYNGDFYNNYRIYTPSDLEALHDLMANLSETEQMKRISLESDVDMTDRPEWSSTLCNSLNAFAGTFDGHNHTIRGLRIFNHGSDEDGGYVGLFGAFAGDTIRNLRLEDCIFEGKMSAGSVVATVITSTYSNPVIENVYVNAQVNGIRDVGGLVGDLEMPGGNLTINNCVFEGAVGLRNTDLDDNIKKRYVGGLVGYLFSGKVTNSAVIASSYSSNETTKSGPFIGDVGSYSVCQGLIQNCYYTGTGFSNYNPDPSTDRIVVESPVVIAGRDSYDIHAAGAVYHREFSDNTMKSFGLASHLGLNNWIYKYNQYPLPVTMEDRWPVEKNVFTLRPANMPTPRTNGFTLLDEVPEAAWHSRDETGDYRDFHTYSFQTSRLWFDESIDPDILDRPQIIPLGIATITATDGIEYVREISAEDIGEKTHEEPLYEVDDEGNLVLDDDDQPIPSDETVTISEGRDYKAVGYSVYLPFETTLPDACKVYQPYDVSTDGDATVFKFHQVKGNVVKAFTPYYVLVQSDTIILSTEAETICPPASTDNNVQLSGYDFVGTTRSISKYSAFHMLAYSLQSDGKWYRIIDDGAGSTEVIIPAFRAFFRATSSTYANDLSMLFDEEEAQAGISTGVVTIQTTDIDGTERYYDLNGRQLPGKPDRGLYIMNGRKYRAD